MYDFLNMYEEHNQLDYRENNSIIVKLLEYEKLF